jgi:hypothetical protein
MVSFVRGGEESTRLQIKCNISLAISQPKYLEIPASRAEKPQKGINRQGFSS